MSGKQFYLYGLKGPDQNYEPVSRYEFMFYDEFDVYQLREAIRRIKESGAAKVYMIYNYHGLRGDYMRALKAETLEEAAVFKDILERGGVEVDAVLG